MADRPAAIEQVRKLLLLSLFNSEANEARSAHALARKLIVKHTLTQAEVLGAAAAKAWSLEDAVVATEKAKEVIASARAVLADPEVQKTVSAIRDLGAGIAKGIGALRKRGTGS